MLRQFSARWWLIVGIALLAPPSLAFVAEREHPREVAVPRVTNTTLEDAFVRLRRARFVVRFAQTFTHPPNSGMLVVAQDPDPGSRVAVGSVVTLRLGGGP